MSAGTTDPAGGFAHRALAIQYGLGLLVLLLVAAPLLPILYQSLLATSLYDAGHVLTLGNFRRLLATPGFGRIVWNTLVFAALTTLLAQLIGSLAAILFSRTDLPGRRLLGELFLVPLYVSALVLSFGWYTLYGPSGYVTALWQSTLGEPFWDLYTLPGMILVAGLTQAPLAYLYSMSSAALADPTLEEAARIAGAGALRTLWRVTLPLMMPAIAYSLVMNFTIALELLSVPLVFGDPARITVMTTFLYKVGITTTNPDHGLVATGALLMLLVICGLIWLQTRLLGSTRRFVTLGGKAARPRPFRLLRWRWPLVALVMAYLLAAVLAPIAVLVLRAFTSFLSPMVPLAEVLSLDNFATLIDYPVYTGAIWNSLQISAIGGAVATLLVALIAAIVHRSAFRYRAALHYVALFPRAVPGMIAGLGFFYAFALLPDLGGLRNSIWIIALAFTMRFIPAGLGAVAPTLLQISPDLDQAARVQGADWWTATRRIVLPLLRPALVACYTVLFISFFKDYSTAIFLFSAGSEVLGTSLMNLWTEGQAGIVAALATIQIVIIAACVGAVRAVFGVKLYG
ncbi:iron ABC transporter permease [Roseomonas sp. 18066]|uniref:ABC transporter permease n=1 Tax=Roseomonas sp. 18066 TaxID=2681412 RepID=UPI001F276929|nr:iron ABC transporter permease [Roseomonas sp. 18066]